MDTDRAEWILSNAQFHYSIDIHHKNYDYYFTDVEDPFLSGGDEDGGERNHSHPPNTDPRVLEQTQRTKDADQLAFRSTLKAFVGTLDEDQIEKFRRVLELSENTTHHLPSQLKNLPSIAKEASEELSFQKNPLPPPPPPPPPPRSFLSSPHSTPSTLPVSSSTLFPNDQPPSKPSLDSISDSLSSLSMNTPTNHWSKKFETHVTVGSGTSPSFPRPSPSRSESECSLSSMNLKVPSSYARREKRTCFGGPLALSDSMATQKQEPLGYPFDPQEISEEKVEKGTAPLALSDTHLGESKLKISLDSDNYDYDEEEIRAGHKNREKKLKEREIPPQRVIPITESFDGDYDIDDITGPRGDPFKDFSPLSAEVNELLTPSSKVNSTTSQENDINTLSEEERKQVPKKKEGKNSPKITLPSSKKRRGGVLKTSKEGKDKTTSEKDLSDQLGRLKMQEEAKTSPATLKQLLREVQSEGPPEMKKAAQPPKESPQTRQEPFPGSLKTRRGMNWNAEYQKLLGMPDNAEKYRGIAQLGLDFVNIAKTYGRVIISERPLPPEMRTIKPVTSSLGGVAGGEKYIVQSILFKFAADVRIRRGARGEVWMYGGKQCSHEYAIKSAGQELQGLVAVHNCKVRNLRTPLMALIDFRGYRLIAQSFLPITTRTLCYGSSDGGRVIHDDDTLLSERIRMVASELNLAPHACLSRKDGRNVVLWGPGDLEGHNGLDGHHYVVDFARVMPPAYTLPALTREDAAKRIIFYQKLRTEFLRSLPFPLSSDAFTVWGRADNTHHNTQVSIATRHLEQTVIPDFATKLLKSKVLNINTILTDMHTQGINFRYLGLVRKNVDKSLGTIPARQAVPSILSVLLLEMIARSQKCILRKLLRQAVESKGVTMDEHLKVVTVNHFNLLLCQSEESRSYWKKDLKSELSRKFKDCLIEDEMNVMYDMKSCVLMRPLLSRLADMIGIEIGTAALEAVENSYTDARILLSDVGSMSPTVKHMNIIEHAQAMSLWLEMRNLDVESDTFDPLARPSTASQVLGHTSVSYRVHPFFSSSTPFCRNRLFEAADSQFARSLRRTPDCVEALCQWGQMLYVQSIRSVGKEAELLCSRSFRLYRTALQLTRYSDRSIIFEFGKCLFERGRRILGQEGPKWRSLLSYAGHCFSFVLDVGDDDRRNGGNDSERDPEENEEEREKGEEEEDMSSGFSKKEDRADAILRKIRKKWELEKEKETKPREKCAKYLQSAVKNLYLESTSIKTNKTDLLGLLTCAVGCPKVQVDLFIPFPRRDSQSMANESQTDRKSSISLSSNTALPLSPSLSSPLIHSLSFLSREGPKASPSLFLDAISHSSHHKKRPSSMVLSSSPSTPSTPQRKHSISRNSSLTNSSSLKNLAAEGSEDSFFDDPVVPFNPLPPFSPSSSSSSRGPDSPLASPLLSPAISSQSLTVPKKNLICGSTLVSTSPPSPSPSFSSFSTSPSFPPSSPPINNTKSSPPEPPLPPPSAICLPLLGMISFAFSKLTSVDLSYFRDQDTDLLLSHLIPSCTNVERLNFRNSEIGPMTLTSVANNCRHLLLLNLQRCPRVTIYSICDVVVSCQFLETLLLQKTAVPIDELIQTLGSECYRSSPLLSSPSSSLSLPSPPLHPPSLKRIHVSRISRELIQMAKKLLGSDVKFEATGHILDDGP